MTKEELIDMIVNIIASTPTESPRRMIEAAQAIINLVRDYDSN